MKVSSKALDLIWSDPEGDGTASHTDDDRSEGDRHHVSIPYSVTPHKRRCDIILPSATATYLRPIEQAEQHNLIRSIAQGRGWLREIMAGTTIRTIALRENRSERMIRMMLSLAFLDPKLVRAALGGTLPRGVSTKRLIDAPVCWHEQWQAIGLPRPN